MLEVTNLAEVNDGLDRWLEACEELADGAYRGLAARAFKYIIEGTPQWSGNLAATWRITVGQPASVYIESPFKSADLGSLSIDREPFNRTKDPNKAALHFALDVARTALAEMRLGADTFISNTAPYAWNVEDNRDEHGKPYLRLVNLPVEMVHAAEAKFGLMGQLSESDALALAKEAL
jgi:hypothetical protein